MRHTWISLLAVGACGPAVGGTATDGAPQSTDSADDTSSAATGDATTTAEPSATDAMATDTTDEDEGICANGSRQSVWARVDSPDVALTCAVPATDCGGDPEGTWILEERCGWTISNPLKTICFEATWEVHQYDVAVTRTFNAGVYDASGVISWAATSHLPPTCLVDLACEDISAFEAVCVDDGAGGCDCMLGDTDAETSASGTYEVVDTTLRVTLEASVEESVFCLMGDAIVEWTVGNIAVTDHRCGLSEDCVDQLGPGHACLPAAALD